MCCHFLAEILIVPTLPLLDLIVYQVCLLLNIKDIKELLGAAHK